MKSSSSVSRRDFIKRSAVLAGAAFAFPTIVPSSVFGQNAPSNRVGVGFVGMGLIVGGHFSHALGRDDCQVLAICDVVKEKRESSKARAEESYAKKSGKGSFKGCDAYLDFEELVTRKDIDAVFVTTPDHWHAPVSAMAMRHGKDVYCQKPMTLTIREGQILRDVQRQYGAVFQVGSQQRSERAFRKACEIVRNGWIGKVHTIYTNLGEFPPPQSLPEQPIPDGFNYDRWLGPTPWYPYNEARVKGNYGGGWRCFWDYGSRKNGDWGAHHFDIIQWALGMDASGPVQFIPRGYEDNKHQTHIYANGTKVLRSNDTDKLDTKGHMIRFIGDKGEVAVSRGDRLDTVPVELKDRPIGAGDIKLYTVTRGHEDNFFECIKTRKPTICTAEIGHRTATICHCSGIAERLGRPLKWDPVKEEIVGDAEAARWTDRPRRAPYTYI
jgi:predicted dehydrogenase